MIKKHVKPSANNPQGSIEEKDQFTSLTSCLLLMERQRKQEKS